MGSLEQVCMFAEQQMAIMRSQMNWTQSKIGLILYIALFNMHKMQYKINIPPL